MLERSEYIETWYSTIALALHRLRGSDARSYSRMCHCSGSTFRKYARMMVSDGLVAEIDYGSRSYPDTRYYLLSEATFLFTNPTRAAYLAIKQMSEDARHKYDCADMQRNERNRLDPMHTDRLWEHYTALREAQRVIYWQLELQIRTAVNVGNS